MNQKPKSWVLINVLIYSVIFILFLFIGVQQIKYVEKNYVEQLESIANLKNEAISTWYEDQLSDINTIIKSDFIKNSIDHLSDEHQDHPFENLQSYLSTIKAQHDIYNLFLIDTSLQLVISATPQVVNYSIFKEQIQNAIQIQKTVATEILSKKNSDLKYIAFIEPIVLENNTIHSVLISVSDVNQFLIKNLEHWPIPTETAETFLCEFTSDSVIVFNTNHEIKNHTPIKKADLFKFISTNAQNGFIKTIDYRGNKVWAYITKVQSTPWSLIIKINSGEIFKNLRFLIAINIAIIIIIIIFVYILIRYFNSIKRQKTLNSYIDKQNEYIKTLNSIGEGVISINTEGKITYINQVAAQMLNKPVNKLLSTKLNSSIELFSAKDQKELKLRFQDYFKLSETQKFNYKLLLSNPQKKLTPVLVSGYPIKNDKGQIKGGVIVIRDETKEHELLKQLKQYSSQLNNILSNLPGVAYKCKNNPNYDIEYVSNGIYDLTGYTPEEFIEQRTVNFGKIIKEEYRDSLWKEIQNSLTIKKPFIAEYIINTKNNEEKWVWEQGVGIYDEKGNLEGLSGIIIDINARKISETELAESQNLYQTLTNNSAVGIFRVDIKGRIIYTNPQLNQLTGFSNTNLVGKSVLNYVGEKNRDEFLEIIRNNNPEKIRIDSNIKFVKNSGEKVWLRIILLPEFDLQRNYIGLTGNVIDITHQIQIQKDLAESHKFLRTLIDNLPDAIYMKDNEGRKIISNKADYITCGFQSEEEILNKNDFDIFPKHIAEGFWKDDQYVLTTGNKIINREQITLDDNNEENTKLISKIPFLDSKGRIKGLIGINRDITEIKRTETEIKILQEAVTQIPISVIISDKNGVIEYVNSHFTKTIGYTPEEIIGKTQKIFQSGTTQNKQYKDLWKDIESGNIWVGELLNKRKDGSLIWERVTIAPIKNNNEEITKYISLKEDITQKKEMMKELTIAKEKAEQSDKLKTSFLANMSHEIRTPLNAIIGFTHLISENNLNPEETQSYMKIIDRSSETLVNIINDIIDISSIETGTIRIFKTEVSINILLKTIYNQFRQKFKDHIISSNEISVTYDDNVTLIVDENRISQVLINLINNANKFTEKGKIEFGVEKIDDHFVQFFVSDTGIGIPKEFQSTIFERFRQADGHNTRKYGGNGLGLSIVKNLVELHHGEIWVESEPNVGSKFCFTLPR